jgi:hypothetical protein
MPNHVLVNVDGTKKWPYLAHDHAKASRINNQAEQNIPISLFVEKGLPRSPKKGFLQD